jgi:hypothetical protein
MWVNGNALCKHEEVGPEVGVRLFGTENTGYQRIITTTIEHIVLAQL